MVLHDSLLRLFWSELWESDNIFHHTSSMCNQALSDNAVVNIHPPGRLFDAVPFLVFRNDIFWGHLYGTSFLSGLLQERLRPQVVVADLPVLHRTVNVVLRNIAKSGRFFYG